MKSQPSIAFQTNPMAITGFAVKTKKQKSGHVLYMTHDSLVPKMAPYIRVTLCIENVIRISCMRRMVTILRGCYLLFVTKGYIIYMYNRTLRNKK